MPTSVELAQTLINTYVAGRQAGTMRGGIWTICNALATWYNAVLPGTNLTPTLYKAVPAPPPAITKYPTLVILPDAGGGREWWENNSTRAHEDLIQVLLVAAPPADLPEDVARKYEDWPAALDFVLTIDPSLGGVCNNVRSVHHNWGRFELGGLAWTGLQQQLSVTTYYGPLQGNIAYVGR